MSEDEDLAAVRERLWEICEYADYYQFHGYGMVIEVGFGHTSASPRSFSLSDVRIERIEKGPIDRYEIQGILTEASSINVPADPSKPAKLSGSAQKQRVYTVELVEPTDV